MSADLGIVAFVEALGEAHPNTRTAARVLEAIEEAAPGE